MAQPSINHLTCCPAIQIENLINLPAAVPLLVCLIGMSVYPIFYKVYCKSLIDFVLQLLMPQSLHRRMEQSQRR